MPESIVCFLDAQDFEGVVRNAVSLGGDADTMACVAGGIAQAYYGGVPKGICDEVLGRLPEDLRSIVDRFSERYGTVQCR